MTHDELRKLTEDASNSAFVGDWYNQGWLMSHGMRQTDAAYIAAANPKTVLELLDEIAELEGEIESLHQDAAGESL